jgi:hypothetical protein
MSARSRSRPATTFTAKSAKDGEGLQAVVFLGVLGDLGGAQRRRLRRV